MNASCLRMNREIHVRLREGLRVKFPWATRPGIRSRQGNVMKRKTGWFLILIIAALFLAACQANYM